MKRSRSRQKDPRKRIFRAGTGLDGQEYGVVRLDGGDKHTYRNKPCPTCPWRKDAVVGAFPPDAYRSSASTCYDASLTTFSCHESGSDKAATCAGFILANSENNMSLRIRGMKGEFDRSKVSNPENIALYESYRAMAIANGVDPEDARIAPCRADDEQWFEVAERVRAHGMSEPVTGEDLIRRARDEDHDDLMKK